MGKESYRKLASGRSMDVQDLYTVIAPQHLTLGTT